MVQYLGAINTWETASRDRRQKGGKTETRRLWASAEIGGYIRNEPGFPVAQQTAIVEKVSLELATGAASKELWYLLTSLPPGRCRPNELLRLFRNPWGIENSLHHVKDSSWDEDRHTLRLEKWFPAAMSMPLRAKACAFHPEQIIARLSGESL